MCLVCVDGGGGAIATRLGWGRLRRLAVRGGTLWHHHKLRLPVLE